MIVTCDHPGCKAVVKQRHADRAGWQLSPFGEWCPAHHKTLVPIPTRPRKVAVLRSSRPGLIGVVRTVLTRSVEE